MARESAGLLMYRFRNGRLEVLLVHPGGPFWKKKDLGAWSMPKGECSAGEGALEAAKREFLEETGLAAEGEFMELGTLRQPSGKRIAAWAFEGDCEASAVRSNLFRIEWPPHSGQQAEFPEVDRAEWFAVDGARSKIQKGQAGFVDGLCTACWAGRRLHGSRTRRSRTLPPYVLPRPVSAFLPIR
jgi:predicted NUDIX family NTP pyrophosphohydrolase